VACLRGTKGPGFATSVQAGCGKIRSCKRYIQPRVQCTAVIAVHRRLSLTVPDRTENKRLCEIHGQMMLKAKARFTVCPPDDATCYAGPDWGVTGKSYSLRNAHRSNVCRTSSFGWPHWASRAVDLAEALSVRAQGNVSVLSWKTWLRLP
jgi:hypothetical protein